MKAVKLQTTTLSGTDGPHLLILGGVHGDEFESMAAIRRLRDRVDPDALQGRLTLIPVVNEAAYRRGQRTSEDGLDLARTCPGNPTGSITERIACAVSQKIEEANYLIDLHSGGIAMHCYPLAGYMLHPDTAVLEAQRRMARVFNLPIVWGTSSHLDGRTLSVARDARIPAIYTEWMGGGQCDPQGVTRYMEGCLNVMAELGMIDRPRPVSRIEYFVEDAREHSGHLQLNYPAPFSGFFEPAVRLKDRVKPGDLLGVVTDPLGDRREEVRSVQSGIVLCLRVYNRILEGESAAAVLEG
ncbi:MAG: succinylglutamate desuccinylase/aspartoacylase family protein [candidate division Zixibacteria bacterium]|nr:succinylglutamate desuccinylase/aspartoacylase family protein [candidate division Zixibacteria bacterium]